MVRRSALLKKKSKKERARPEPIKATPVRREKVPQGREREPLKVRRKRARKFRRRIILAILIILLVGAGVCLWLPLFRVEQVQASGPHAPEIQSLVLQSIAGSKYYAVPKNSFFFIPKSEIRTAIQHAYPDVAAVTIKRTSLNGLAVVTIPRESAFLWCGVSSQAITFSDASTTSNGDPCYDADSLGYVFAPEPGAGTTLKIYGALETTDPNVLGQRIADARHIPSVLQFVKVMRGLGVSISTIDLRGDEADLYTLQNTRITYVLGKEATAAQLATSAFPTMNINDGSLEYVDLRFDGKVYFKKVGSAQSSTSAQ
jgi:hypothetical protein